MDKHVEELLTIHNNFLRSRYIIKYTTDELMEAKKILEDQFKFDTRRYQYIHDEIARREEEGEADGYEDYRYSVIDPRRIGFTKEEWEDFRRRWAICCMALKKGEKHE